MTPRTSIRRARPDDCATLTRIAHAAKRHWGYPERWMRLWRADLSVTPAMLDDHLVYCAVRAGRVIAFYGVSGTGAERELEHLFVSPRWIGTGVGRRLFVNALARLGALGVRRLRVASDPNARGFYLAMGGRRTGTVPSKPRGRRLPFFVFDVATNPSA